MLKQQNNAPEVSRAEYTQALWRQARSDDSNLVLDWLWLYSVLDDDTQRLHSLRKALEIDPHDTAVQHILGQLEHKLSRRAAPSRPCVEG